MSNVSALETQKKKKELFIIFSYTVRGFTIKKIIHIISDQKYTRVGHATVI